MSPAPRARLRLFCLPCAGGGASRFSAWGTTLPPGIETCALQPPGREERLAEPPFTRMAPLVAALAAAIDDRLGIPYALFGHSLGALVAFELARALRRAGRPEPLRLFVSASRAPHLPDPAPPLHRASSASLRAELRRLNGTPDEVLASEELMSLMEPLLRADFAVNETYVHAAERPLRCPVTVLGGRDDAEVPHDALAAWRRHTEGSFTLRLFPGDHFFIETAERSVLEVIASDLASFLPGGDGAVR